jgi:hypothetical protein
MSDISINSGEQINVSVKQPTLQNTIVIPRPTTSMSVKGVTGGGGDAHFVYEQNMPSAVWVITHNLGKKPVAVVVDSTENVVIGDLQYNSLNTLTITFVDPFSGKAYLN